MPPVTGKSALVQKYGPRFLKAAEEHQNDEVQISGFSDLPPNINNGVAKLTKCYFAQFKEGDNKGEYYFRAEGTVIEPVEAPDYDQQKKVIGTVRTFGATTSIQEPVCDTPNSQGKRKTMADHLGWVQNQLKLLGLSAEDVAGDRMEASAEALVKADPPVYFKFRTWRGLPTPTFQNPRTQSMWQGAIPDYVEAQANGMVADNSAPDARVGGGASSANGVGETETAEEVVDADADGALAELVEKADGGDSSAMEALTKMATGLGVDQGDIDGADNWGQVQEMIETAQAGGGTAAEEEPEPEPEPPADPARGEAVSYRPIDPKTKKPVKNPVECEVTAVDKKSKTVTLKRLDDKKVITKVKWDDLIR